MSMETGEMAAVDRPGRARGRWAALVACSALVALAGASAFADPEPATTGAEPLIRRLSQEQYRQVIADVFGPTIKIAGRFEPDIRQNGLLAVGAGRVSVTATGLEQYDAMARSVAAQVVSEPHRSTLVPCKPAALTDIDDACTSQFVAKAGRMLYRRPLTESEVKGQVAVADAATKKLKSFYSGLEMALAGMLEAPEFLFRQQTVEADPDHRGQYRLDAYSKASQLSFLLWDSTPDRMLLAAAENGELNSQKGLTKQVDRLLASPRVEAGVRAFFTDMLGFEDFTTLSKDAAIYPKFTPEVARDAREQTLRTLVDHLVTRKGDYRDIFTTRRTFLTPMLAAVYSLPLAAGADAPNGAVDNWVPYEYGDGDPRGTGILTEVSFVALHSHPGRSSPTLRGKALREVLLCQKVPDPPGNVNFTVVQETNNPKYKTTRDRVTAHRTDPTCAGCHKLIDPMGLAMENFDSAGGYRKTENGAQIDSSGELDGMKFTDATGLGKAMHDNPAAPACLVNRLYSYSAGRPAVKGESEFVRYLEKGFAADGYRVPDLLRRIATSDALYRVTAPQTGALDGAAPRLATQQTNLLQANLSQETGK